MLFCGLFPCFHSSLGYFALLWGYFTFFGVLWGISTDRLLVINEICIFVMCASPFIEPVHVVIFLMLFLLVINETCIVVLCARQLMKPVHAFILLYLLVINELIKCLLIIWCWIYTLLFNVCVQFHTSIDVCMSIYVLLMLCITLYTVHLLTNKDNGLRTVVLFKNVLKDRRLWIMWYLCMYHDQNCLSVCLQ